MTAIDFSCKRQTTTYTLILKFGTNSILTQSRGAKYEFNEMVSQK